MRERLREREERDNYVPVDLLSHMNIFGTKRERERESGERGS